jgi:hypothetical protein
MTLSPQTVIFVAVMLWIVGFAVGWIAGGWRGNSEKSRADAPPGGRKGAYIPLVKLWRERTGTRLVVEFDSKAYLSREPLQPGQLKNLRRLAADFSAWVGLSAVLADTPPATQTPVDETLVEIPIKSDVEQPVLPQEEVTPPISRPVNAAAPVTPPAIQAAPEAPKSITGQIEEILQGMLAGTPLDNRGIHLIENSRSGVVVWVGKESFDGIGSVPYPEVTDAIRRAVKEWEKRAG